MRVFVTGATGFIGRHLCQELTARGDHVVALVRSAAKAGSLPHGVEAFPGDLSLFADERTVLPEVDVVVHLAGVVAADNLAQYHRINHDAVRDLVRCLARQRWTPRRLLFASSLAAAGPSPNGRAWTEDDALEPIEDYGRAKAKAEAVVREAPFPTTSFRPPVVFGPLDDATLTLFRSARAGIGVRVAGTPQQLSFVDVRDLVRGIALMADDARAGSFVYYVSHPEPMNTHLLWQELAAAVGKKVAVVPVPRPMLRLAMLGATAFSRVFGFKNQLDEKQYAQMVAPAFVCSSARIRTELGWTARHGLREALENAARGYREAGRL